MLLATREITFSYDDCLFVIIDLIFTLKTLTFARQEKKWKKMSVRAPTTDLAPRTV